MNPGLRKDATLNPRTARLALAWLLVIVTIACGASPEATSTVPAGTVASTFVPGAADRLSVAQIVQALDQAPDSITTGTVVTTGYVGSASSAGQSAIPTSAQSGCPVVLDRLPTLTDAPFPRTFTVAGVTLPNALPSTLPALRLVIPYDLGMIELPPHGEFEGRLLDPDYAACPEHERLFILERIVQALPHDDATTPDPPLTQTWPRWQDTDLGIALSYPTGWTVQESRNVGAILQAVFTAPDQSQTVRLSVTAGQTVGVPGEADHLPHLLQGDRQLPALLGPARARLIDVQAEPTSAAQSREVRLVLNYQGNTVALSTRFTDGVDLDQSALDRFTAIAQSATFSKPVDASDPLDPTLTAKAEIGNGPFLDQASAHYAALMASGLHQATAEDARLVSEQDARLAVPGACRDFPERPEAVWLVSVSGLLPTGQEARRLVYLDAETGTSVCQTDAPAHAP